MKQIVFGMRSGKSKLMEKLLAEYLKKNPNVTICSFRNGEIIIEKPIKEIPIKLIENK
jgi:hypothetical protein